MKTQSKTISGELLDIETKNLVEVVSLVITQEIAGPLDDQPHRYMKAITKGFKPHLADKNYILKISDIISGKILLSTQVNTGNVDYDKTEFTVLLQDDVWLKSDWFKLI